MLSWRCPKRKNTTALVSWKVLLFVTTILGCGIYPPSPRLSPQLTTFRSYTETIPHSPGSVYFPVTLVRPSYNGVLAEPGQIIHATIGFYHTTCEVTSARECLFWLPDGSTGVDWWFDGRDASTHDSHIFESVRIRHYERRRAVSH